MTDTADLPEATEPTTNVRREREKLPDRRRHANVPTALKFRRPHVDPSQPATVQEAHLGLGFYPDGRVGEVFVKTKDLDSDTQFIVEDACTLISALMQFGVPPEEIAFMVGHRVGVPTSVIGAICKAVAQAEAESDMHGKELVPQSPESVTAAAGEVG